MTRLEALKSLLAKVEAGRCPSINLCLAAIPDWSSLIMASFDGSLDAAKDLHEAVLPGWSCAINTNGIAQAIGPIGERWTGCSSDTPARAWLIAILKALIAKEEG